METSQPPSHEDIAEAIKRLTDELSEAYPDPSKLTLIGIARGGVELGKRIQKALAEKLSQDIPYGVVDISFHRDDISSNPVPNIQSFANLPFNVEGKHVVLIDDVVFSGRSVRAALNEVFDQGRPNSVKLAVLVDRGGRSLPIQPDFVGLSLDVEDGQRVEVSISDQSDTPDTISIET